MTTLSFHPCYEADINILCAGREPDENDRSAIRAARAVILPQGCNQALYHMVRANCSDYFPNYDARFDYPGKTGQAGLFKAAQAPHPRTWICNDTEHFSTRGPELTQADFPLVFKLDWGGGGDTVFLLRSQADLETALSGARAHERSGRRGFILQPFVYHANRTLRVAVIGRTFISYWRVQDNPLVFGDSVDKGARIDAESEPDRRRKAVEMTRGFCKRYGIDLAGFDLLFDESGSAAAADQPLFLEINYFFGRTGLGGSQRFYRLLQTEIDRWLAGLDSALRRPGLDSTAKEQSE